jgi:hypothetical protein
MSALCICVRACLCMCGACVRMVFICMQLHVISMSLCVNACKCEHVMRVISFNIILGLSLMCMHMRICAPILP